MPCRLEGSEYHYNKRQRTGPTGKKDIYILVDACSLCGKMKPVYPEKLSLIEQDWVNRWNKRMDRELKGVLDE